MLLGEKKSKTMKDYFKLNHPIPQTRVLAIALSGLILLLFLWWLVTQLGWVDRAALPGPGDVFGSYGAMVEKKVSVPVGQSTLEVSSLVFNTGFSVFLNVVGYLEAIVFSLLFGFMIGVVPFFKALLSKYIDAIRFVPLAAMTMIFISWFGIDLNMKVQFLAFGIFVYLLPVVVQRIDEVERVYVQTAYTLGATNWQIIRNVYWPHVTSKIIDDIRVLTAISWTYIIVAETVNKEYGVGALIATAQKYNRIEEVYALLLLIVLVGVLQDLLFQWLDKVLFPHKYK